MPQPVVRPVNGFLGRLLASLFALALGLLAVFVFTAFAVVAAILALVGLARLWWLQRRAGGRSAPDVLEPEYSVSRDPGAAREPDAILPPRPHKG